MAKQIVLSKDGTKIAYDKTGHGPVVIIVLGALNSRKSGAKLAKLLAPHFTVISYDRRGRGDSTDTTPYSPEREVEDLAALLNEVGEPVYLYGHSSGAAIALETAMKLHKQVKKLAIYEAPYALDTDAQKAAKEYNKQIKKIIAAGQSADAVALFLQYIGVSEKQVAALKKMPMWKGLVTMAPTLAYDSDVLGEGHALPSKQLAEITTPTLVMDGGKSPAFMRSVAESLSNAISKAQYLTLDGQTHGVKPAILAPVLLEFFR